MTTPQQQTNAWRDELRERYIAEPYEINSNGTGIHIRCAECGTTSTNPETFFHQHLCQ